jgi:small subunit ribosomal protein S6
MQRYEVVVIIRTELSEEDRATLLETVKSWITDKGGTIEQVDQWGRRRLAYPIAKQRDGYYVLIKTSSDPSVINELERNLRLTENILRFLITRAEE